MKDNELMQTVRRQAEADPERTRTPHLERFAAGELGAGEKQALESRAAEEGEAEMLALLAPMDEKWLKATEARVNRSWSKGSAKTSNRGALWAASSGVLALAAAVAFRLLAPHADVEGIPHYEMAVSGETHATRGAAHETQEAPLFATTSDVHLVMRPDHAAKGPLTAKAAVRGPADVHFVTANVVVSEQGSVRIDAPATQLFEGPAGDREIIVVVGRPDAMPKKPGDLAKLTNSESATVLHANIRWAGN